MSVRFLLIVVAALLARTAFAQGQLPMASGGENLWIVVPRLDGSTGWTLLHHARGMNGPYVREAWPLTDLPEGVAAWDDTVWLIYPKPKNHRGRDREVMRQATQQNSLTQQYIAIPPDRFEILPALDGDGKLLDFVGSPRGPVAVLRGHSGGDLEVHMLVGGDWRTLPAPNVPDAAHADVVWLGDSDGELVIVVAAENFGSLRVMSLAADGERWQMLPSVEVDGHVMDVVALDGQLAAIVRNARGETTIEVLRPTGVVEIANLGVPSGALGVVGHGVEVVCAEFTMQRDVLLRRMDSRRGEVSAPVRLVEPPSNFGDWMHVPLLGVLTLLVVIVTVLVEQVVSRPQSSAPRLSMSGRIAAIGIDVGIGAGVTVLALRCSPGDLLNLPSWTFSWQAAQPALIMALATVVHSLIGELLTGRSVGLWIVGGRIRDLRGGRPRVASILVRQTLRFLTILSPALAIVALVNKSGETAGDLLGRVQIVSDEDPSSPNRAKPADPGDELGE